MSKLFMILSDVSFVAGPGFLILSAWEIVPLSLGGWCLLAGLVWGFVARFCKEREREAARKREKP